MSQISCDFRANNAPGLPIERFILFSRNFGMICDSFDCAFRDGCEWHFESAPDRHRLHPTQYEMTCNVPPPASCHCHVILMPCGSVAKGRSPFPHIKSKQYKARRLSSSEDIVSRELGAPYTVQHLPDIGQIMLTPATTAEGVAEPYGALHVREDRRGSVAHPVTSAIEDRGAVPQSSSN